MPEADTYELRCAELFDGSSMLGPSRVVVEGHMVVAVERAGNPGDHALVAPGLVDLQVNGFGAHDVAVADRANIAALDTELAASGTTTWLATLVTDSLDRMGARISALDTVIAEGGTGCAGIHLEGPFLGARAGAHARRHIRTPDIAWIEALPRTVRLMTLGAETQGAEQATSALRTLGITVSIGHSAPTGAEYESVVSAGASMVTHLFNAMTGVHHRDDSLALSALTDERVTPGVIADMVHVSPRAVKLSFMARPGSVCLVSDSVAWTGAWAGRNSITVKDGAPRLPDGTLAGSCTPLAECVSRSIRVAGVPPHLALAAATSTPARCVGLRGAGRVAVGGPADLVAFDQAYSVTGVWRRLPSARDFSTDT